MLGKLYIRAAGGPRIVACQTGGGIPRGLALTLVPITDDPEGDARWSVTHVASGYRLGPGWTLLQDARHAAERLADLTDWCRPWRTLAADAPLEVAVDRALKDYAAQLEAR